LDLRSVLDDCLRGGSVTRMEAVFMAGMAIAAIVFSVIVQLSGLPSSVKDGYFPYADAMFHGVLPYTDKIFVYGYWNVWEYPPLAYVFLFIPRLLGVDSATYQIAYVALILVVIWVGMRSIGNIAEHLGYSRLHAVSLYSGMLILLIEFVFDRYDVLPLVICILAIQFFLERRYALAASVTVIGTFVKLYPALLFIIFIVWLIARGDMKKLINAVIGFAVACCVVIPFLITGDISQMFAYHSDRPLEIESMFGAFCALVAAVMPDTGMHVVFSYGSDNIVGGISDALSSIVTYVMIASVASVYIFYIWLIRRSPGGEKTGRSSSYVMVLVVAAFITFNSVFSAQYLVWLIPFVIVMMMFSEKDPSNRMLLLFVMACALTQLDFLLNFGLRSEGCEVSFAGALVLVIRNILMVYMMWYVCRQAVTMEKDGSAVQMS